MFHSSRRLGHSRLSRSGKRDPAGGFLVIGDEPITLTLTTITPTVVTTTAAVATLVTPTTVLTTDIAVTTSSTAILIFPTLTLPRQQTSITDLATSSTSSLTTTSVLSETTASAILATSSTSSLIPSSASVTSSASPLPSNAAIANSNSNTGSSGSGASRIIAAVGGSILGFTALAWLLSRVFQYYRRRRDRLDHAFAEDPANRRSIVVFDDLPPLNGSVVYDEPKPKPNLYIANPRMTSLASPQPQYPVATYGPGLRSYPASDEQQYFPEMQGRGAPGDMHQYPQQGVAYSQPVYPVPPSFFQAPATIPFQPPFAPYAPTFTQSVHARGESGSSTVPWEVPLAPVAVPAEKKKSNPAPAVLSPGLPAYTEAAPDLAPIVEGTEPHSDEKSELAYNT
ncbi:hypothetical protein C8J56DRAFT_1164686 [Mycena floridula]|nr:hypothetical protein C8J56DRAFT_1164686 [Mycena floridula]